MEWGSDGVGVVSRGHLLRWGRQGGLEGERTEDLREREREGGRMKEEQLCVNSDLCLGWGWRQW